MAPISRESLQYIIHHVVLPPQLPSSAEDVGVTRDGEKQLLQLTLRSIQGLSRGSSNDVKPTLAVLEKTTRHWAVLNAEGNLPSESILKWLADAGKDDVVSLVIHAQNAGLILRIQDAGATFETYELSPQQEAVIGCKSALRRSFPSGAIFVPNAVFNDGAFRKELAEVLSKLDVEAVDEMAPTAKKAGHTVKEVRDTVHPGLVSDMLMAILASVGKSVPARQIHKRIRDDVVWDSSLLPWRRSSLWLAIRVTLQTSLFQMLPKKEAFTTYKNFMVIILTKILDSSLTSNLPLDICFIIQAKIARRSFKLGTGLLDSVHDDALNVGRAYKSKVNGEWQTVQERDPAVLVKIDLASIEGDTAMTLHSCRQHLDSVLNADQPMFKTPARFATSCAALLTYQHDRLPNLQAGLSRDSDLPYALAKLELWVAHDLSAWTTKAITSPNHDHCSGLASLALDYKQQALPAYSESPEQLSMMLLTIAELWLALDTVAGKLIPLLHDFSPELHDDLFHPLLLPRREDMARLKAIEDHIALRREKSKPHYAPIFSDPVGTGKFYFSSLYYDLHPEMVALGQRITKEANNEWGLKKAEWGRRQSHFDELKAKIAAMSCSTVVDEWGDESHAYDCSKCRTQKEANGMMIDIYEWPLPAHEAELRAAVFELACPQAFAAWRNLTWMLIQDLGRITSEAGKSVEHTVCNYHGLREYQCQSSNSRITLASSIKSSMSSHYAQVRFPTTPSDIFRKNALHYLYYDTGSQIWIHNQTQHSDFARHCQSKIPEGAYRKLQFAIDSTTHTQSEVIAVQHSCSKLLTLHELVAFGSLRADGEKSQWLNIRRELGASNLSLNTEAVCTLVTQSALQVGCKASTQLRLAHSILDDPHFALELLVTINSLFTSIEANWKCEHSMRLIIIVTSRILSLTSNEQCRVSAIGTLHKCRLILVDWIKALEKVLETTIEGERIQKVQQNLLTFGLLGKSTYDLDSSQIRRLMKTAVDVEHWVLFAIVVHDNTPGSIDRLPSSLRRLLLNDKRVSFARRSTLNNLISNTNNAGLDRAVKRIWSGFSPSPIPWTLLGTSNVQWVQKETLPSECPQPQQVTYNLLSGELLVDGRPLGRLPKEYIHSDLYSRVFGSQIFPVFTSGMPVMEYMTARDVEGYQIHFGKRANDIIIRLRKQNRVWEVIPHEKLRGDFPSLLVDKYLHWLDLSKRTLEFRALGRLKDASTEWQLEYHAGSRSIMKRGDEKLVDVQSKTARSIATILAPLELPSHIPITTSKDSLADIELPRLGLNFFLNKAGHLECKELRKIVDPNQSIGTLIGLRSKLILCEPGEQAQALDRIVIVPRGKLSISKNENHVAVSISNDTNMVKCFRFHVDVILGRLRGVGGLVSELYLAYLHALTSNILPDPLTRRTGTEEALSMLEDQTKQVCEPPCGEVVELLKLLSALTPQRRFYPKHLQVMEQVDWSTSLSFLSQHDMFAQLCDQLLSSGNRFQIFAPKMQEIGSLGQAGAPHLLRRALSRNSTFRNPQYGSNIDALDDDQVYPLRKSFRDGRNKTYNIASLVMRWPSRLQTSRQIAADFRSWKTVSGFGKQFATAKSIVDLLHISLSTSWAPLYNLCCRSSPLNDKYKLLFAFGIIAFGPTIVSLNDLRTLLAFAFLEELQTIELPPSHEHYKLGNGHSPDKAWLINCIKNNARAFVRTSSGNTSAQLREQRTSHQNQIVSQAEIVAQSYMGQWPCARPTTGLAAAAPALNIVNAHGSIVSQFEEWTKNSDMEVYLSKVQKILDKAHEPLEDPTTPCEWQSLSPSTFSYVPYAGPTLASLLSKVAPKVKRPPDLLQLVRPTLSPGRNDRLQNILADVGQTSKQSGPESMYQKYKKDLGDSILAFQVHKEPMQTSNLPVDIAIINDNYVKCESYLQKTYARIHRSLEPDTAASLLLQTVGVWPRRTLSDLLRLLASNNDSCLRQQWKDCLLKLGKAVTQHQRARRLVLAAESGKLSNFLFEAENIGCMGWDAKDHPDWLLIEIQNDFLIRQIQARVAQQMIAPTDLSNTLTQLNMGEGKSSVIVPIVAATLANGKQLSRVLVLRSLSRQMLHILAQRLGGLVGRQIYFMPFSRKTTVNPTMLAQMQTLYDECLKTRGVLLVQPEFLLSFKLMGIERLTSEDYGLSDRLLKIQEWLDAHARDLLDESDEILDVKFQLIYTIGRQRSMDGQPDRWLLMQSLLDSVDTHATAMASSFPGLIDVERRLDGSFPTIRLLSPHAGPTLISYVVDDVINSKLPTLNLESWTKADRRILRVFLEKLAVGTEQSSRIANLCKQDESLMKKLLLVRGLIAHRVLLFVLRSKRWSVNFGQHPSRCLVAVPYRAKGVPAATAEFGHPDVTIALTCLTYYYSGLSDSQLRLCFELLQKADDPTSEYQLWTQRCSTLSRTLKDWNSVNLEDERQCLDSLFPAVRYSKNIADFFMANVVFPREGKEFDHKLSTSGWDIPRTGVQLTTGFSGTNDNRFLLPTSITQHDLPELRHTSGKVLDYVLRAENLQYECAKDANARQLSARGLLGFIAKLGCNVRCLIDVGAQVLDTTNEDAVRYWISIVDSADAGVFFNANDEVMVVVKQTWKIEPFAISSFSGRMDRCLVYLDEVHTRGTDLPLPKDARAVVTLGPRLTKDRLVQACMRLRKLAHGQSLLFVAPPEVHTDIIKVTGKRSDDRLDGYDVIRWALAQSLMHIERSEPLRIMQGLSYHRRQKVAQRYLTVRLEADKRKSAAQDFVENEEQSLHDLYAPSTLKAPSDSSLLQVSSKDTDPEVQILLHRWNQIDPSTADGANVQEEHEREVAHEVEQETEIQRPPRAKPLKEIVDENLEKYVKGGSLNVFDLFKYADEAIVRKSSAAKLLGKKRVWNGLRVSKGFCSTVESPVSGYLDEYLRPVNWILTRKADQNASRLLIISQHEVNQLFGAINDPSSAVTLHIYEPKVTRTMSSVDSRAVEPLTQATQNWLKIHPSVRRQLHLFAGQLYINTHDEYLALRQEVPSFMVPLPFLKEWMAIRRRGQNFLQTHIGRVVNGWSLQESDFQ